MRFYADLHIHSKHSRATSRDCDLEHLAWWARRKGITVVGTGDFTHPAWWEEIQEKLVPAEPGLLRLRPDLEREVEKTLPAACRGPIRFLLEVEISTIYKSRDKTRKIHHLIYAATFDTAARFREGLGGIGNIASDGRPILGLDARHLLEIVLESGDDAYLIPAHIWTPWFAVLGSKGGFDSIVDCYGDLAGHIFAVETGLSSDPPMNWRVSALDHYTLVSNSDAHSPPMLGREACVFDTELDYFALRRALESGEGFGGTVEFFPQEGKYHLDGHRACGVRLEPGETRRRDGRCPICGKPVTIGVLHRVEELADRPAGEPPASRAPFRSLVPLPELVSEIHGVGPRSKAVGRTMANLATRLGPEMEILESQPLEDVERTAGALLAEGLRRLRAGEVQCQGGYDGEYGTIRVFEPGEVSSQMSLFGGLAVAARPAVRPPARPPSRMKPEAGIEPVQASPSRGSAGRGGAQLRLETRDGELLEALDPDQRAAAEIVEGPLLIVAGPGTGKTRTLTHRIAHQVALGAAPDACLAVTFTRRAAGEMRQRLTELLPGDVMTGDVMTGAGGPLITTFHGLGLEILRREHAELGLDRAFQVAEPAACLELLGECCGLSRADAGKRLAELSVERRTRPEGEPSEDLGAYRQALRDRDLVDFDDLLALPVRLFAERADRREVWRQRFPWVSIDEYQDIDAVQYRLVEHLTRRDGNVCAIGDPDQSIYRFRGADVGFFLRFREDHPQARVVELRRNYRSTATIVRAAQQAIAPASLVPDRRMEAMVKGASPKIWIREAASERAEAEGVVKSIEELLGGTSYFSIDSGRLSSADAAQDRELSFDDFAVLYRTRSQAGPLAEALERSGIPFQRRSHDALLERDEVRLLQHELEVLRAAGEAEEHDVTATLRRARERTAADAHRLDVALELLAPLAAQHAGDLDGFLTALALGAEVDTWDPRAQRVSLLTLHAAKGLEFPVVVLVGCDDGLLPLTWGGSGDVDLDEERRLFFVGMTRARSRLVLTRARRRSWRGASRETAPSPFLSDLDESFLERRAERSKRRAAGDGRQLRLL